MSYKAAFLGLIIGEFIYTVFCLYFLRIPLKLVVTFLLFCIAGAVGVARARALVGHPGYPWVYTKTNAIEILGSVPKIGMVGMTGTGY
jgi:hypothetical protein